MSGPNSRPSAFVGCSHDVFHRNQWHSDLNPFCTKENWQSAVLALAQELEVLGLQSPCASDASGQANLDVVSLVNITWNLLKLYRGSLSASADHEVKLQHLHRELEQLHVTSSRQKDVAEAKRRQARELAERERKANEIAEEEKERARMAREEVKRLNAVLVQRTSQYHHELRRKDQELTKLKEHVIRMLSDKASLKIEPVSIQVASSSLRREDQARPKWKKDSLDRRKDDDRLKRLMEDFECKLEELRSENLQLREILSDLLSGLAPRLDADRGQANVAAVALLPLDVGRSGLDAICSDIVKAVEDRSTNGEATQAAGDLETQRREIERERRALDLTRKQFMTATIVGQKDYDWEQLGTEEAGPSWTFGNATFTLCAASGVTSAVGVSGLRPPTPVRTLPSRPHSRAAASSRTQSATRSPSRRPTATSGVSTPSCTAPRKPRPKSAHFSPQRLTLVKKEDGGKAQFSEKYKYQV